MLLELLGGRLCRLFGLVEGGRGRRAGGTWGDRNNVKFELTNSVLDSFECLLCVPRLRDTYSKAIWRFPNAFADALPSPRLLIRLTGPILQ